MNFLRLIFTLIKEIFSICHYFKKYFCNNNYKKKELYLLP